MKDIFFHCVHRHTVISYTFTPHTHKFQLDYKLNQHTLYTAAATENVYKTYVNYIYSICNKVVIMIVVATHILSVLAFKSRASAIITYYMKEM